MHFLKIHLFPSFWLTYHFHQYLISIVVWKSCVYSATGNLSALVSAAPALLDSEKVHREAGVLPE